MRHVCKILLLTLANTDILFAFFLIKSQRTIHLFNVFSIFINFRCNGNYYGKQCEIDGEVVAVAVGASVAAVVIIMLTLTILCLWR
jgi:hypothetical protein